MTRQAFVLAAAAVVLAAGTGCRNSCGNRSGWFHCSSRGPAPCALTSRPHTEACCDPVVGTPVSGVGGAEIPGGLLPGYGVPALPGAIPGGHPDVLPYPQPNGLIPPAGIPGVPFAPPSPAPGDGTVGALPAPRMGVPVSK
jgi:hypothetical protein